MPYRTTAAMRLAMMFAGNDAESAVKKTALTNVYIIAGFALIVAGALSDTWSSRVLYSVAGMVTLLAGVLHAMYLARNHSRRKKRP